MLMVPVPEFVHQKKTAVLQPSPTDPRAKRGVFASDALTLALTLHSDETSMIVLEPILTIDSTDCYACVAADDRFLGCRN